MSEAAAAVGGADLERLPSALGHVVTVLLVCRVPVRLQQRRGPGGAAPAAGLWWYQGPVQVSVGTEARGDAVAQRRRGAPADAPRGRLQAAGGPAARAHEPPALQRRSRALRCRAEMGTRAPPMW